MENLDETLSGIVIVAGFVLIVFIIAKYTYLIKKAMIEKGVTTIQSGQKFRYLDIGCIVMGLGFGLLFSSIYTNMNITEDTMDLLVWGTISVFGGMGLIAAHFVRNKLDA